jgi:hypothetical protein
LDLLEGKKPKIQTIVKKRVIQQQLPPTVNSQQATQSQPQFVNIVANDSDKKPGPYTYNSQQMTQSQGQPVNLVNLADPASQQSM